MPTITRAALIDGLIERAKRGAYFATLETLTDARLKKTGNPLAGVRKRSTVNVVLNWQYTRAVNRQRTREGLKPDFEPRPRAWGKRIRGTPLVRHREKLFVETKVQRVIDTGYELQDGTAVDAAQIAPFMPARAEVKNQGLDEPIILRDYAIESIVAITIDGERHEIEPSNSPLPEPGGPNPLATAF